MQEQQPKRRGGRRPGAGRPRGKAGNTLSVVQAAAARAEVTGKLPHQLLLEWARGEPILVNGELVHLTAQNRIACAIAAGPYFAPRLISHEVGGKGGGSIPLSLNASVAFYVPENGRRVAPPAPENDAAVAVPHRGNGSGGNGSGQKAA